MPLELLVPGQQGRGRQAVPVEPGAGSRRSDGRDRAAFPLVLSRLISEAGSAAPTLAPRPERDASGRSREAVLGPGAPRRGIPESRACGSD